MISDLALRTQLKVIVAETQTAGVIWPYNALSHDLAEWPGLFGPNRNGWIIKRAGSAGVWKNFHFDRRKPTYDLWHFYKFRQGSEADNSDNEFGANVDAVAASFEAKPTLDLDSVEKHDLLQFRLTTIDCGEETLHLALCSLTVHLCC